MDSLSPSFPNLVEPTSSTPVACQAIQPIENVSGLLTSGTMVDTYQSSYSSYSSPPWQSTRVSDHAQMKYIDFCVERQNRKEQTEEQLLREKNQANVAVERDSLRSSIVRYGDRLVYRSERIEADALNAPLISGCEATLYQKEEDLTQEILGISFGENSYYLAKSNWCANGLKKLLIEAGEDIHLCKDKSRKIAHEKILAFLVDEARHSNVVIIPSTYGWHGSGADFHYVSVGDILWEELVQKCVTL